MYVMCVSVHACGVMHAMRVCAYMRGGTVDIEDEGCECASDGVSAATAAAATTAAAPSAVGRGFEAFRTPGRGAGRGVDVVESDDDDSDDEGKGETGDGVGALPRRNDAGTCLCVCASGEGGREPGGDCCAGKA
eukprot:GHVU01168996.1.p1 GENE.GHVU01168996.1~~GHVU01168996.1.p1  ORF type:complete len:134 (+),score=17.16 GHVU01168996.1:189-590(+)